MFFRLSCFCWLCFVSAKSLASNRTADQRQKRGKTSLRPYFLLKLQCFQVIQFSTATANLLQDVVDSVCVCVCVCLPHLHSSSVNFFTFLQRLTKNLEFQELLLLLAASCAHPNPFPWPIVCRPYNE